MNELYTGYSDAVDKGGLIPDITFLENRLSRQFKRIVETSGIEVFNSSFFDFRRTPGAITVSATASINAGVA